MKRLYKHIMEQEPNPIEKQRQIREEAQQEVAEAERLEGIAPSQAEAQAEILSEAELDGDIQRDLEEMGFGEWSSIITQLGLDSYDVEALGAKAHTMTGDQYLAELSRLAEKKQKQSNVTSSATVSAPGAPAASGESETALASELDALLSGKHGSIASAKVQKRIKATRAKLDKVAR